MTTNGLVSAQQAYPTAQRLLGCGVRAATVALNSADPKQYAALMRPEPSGCGHADVCTFITLCAEVGVQVSAGLPASSSPSLPLVGTGADASERCKAVWSLMMPRQSVRGRSDARLVAPLITPCGPIQPLQQRRSAHGGGWRSNPNYHPYQLAPVPHQSCPRTHAPGRRAHSCEAELPRNERSTWLHGSQGSHWPDAR